MPGMKNRLSLATALLALAFPANAGEGLDLATKSRAMAGTGAPAPNASAPFVASHDPLAGIFMREEQERRGPAGTCEAAARDLCYDLAAGRVTYTGARRYMPRLGNGLAAESVSLRRDAIVLRYTFK
jgi:hypothetical protein